MAPSTSTRHKRSRTSPSRTSRNSQNIPKLEITVNVYDLLPPGRLSNILWTFGSGLLHSGVVIQNREYAYGGHSKRDITGVYYTRPSFEPPGGTFRCSILQGFTFHTAEEVQRIMKDVSDEFLGTSYNLLTYNCNHFTSALCERLTGKPAPGWLNRAASIGLALPCMVPKEWVNPPDVETADGELVDVDEDTDGTEDSSGDERAAMLDGDRRRRQREEELRQKGVGRMRNGGGPAELGLADADSAQDEEDDGSEAEEGSMAGGKRLHSHDRTPPPRLVSAKDMSGRELPVAERAPVPKRMKN